MIKNINQTGADKIKRYISQVLFASMIIMTCKVAEAQIAPVNIPSGGFHIDGNVTSNVPTVNVGDWVAGPGGSGGGVLTGTGIPIDASKTIHIIDAYNSSSDISFTGSKANANPNDATRFKWTTAAVSNKSDIHNACVHLSKDPSNNQTWLMLSGDRRSTTGTTYLDFEFLQNTIVRGPAGSFISDGPHGGRTVNDFVLTVEYTNGGAIAIIKYFTWQETSTPGTYDYMLMSPPSSIGFAFTSANGVSVPYGAFGGTTYSTNQFVEGAVNLDAFIGSVATACTGLSIKSVFIKTKASAAISANLEDLVEPIQVTFDIGFTVSATASAILCHGGNSTVTVTANNATGNLEYKMNNGPWQTSNQFNVPAGGPYTFYAKNAAGCTTNGYSLSVSQPNAISASTTTSNESWAGAQNGSITVNASGGTGSYTYAIAGPMTNNTGQNNGSFTGLIAGNYSITITDANNCSSTINATISNTCQIPACLITGSAVTCPEGQATFSAPAGMTGYHWEIISGGATITGANNQQTVTVTTPPSCGSFTVALTINQNICTSDCQMTVNVVDNEAPTFSNLPANTQVSCGQLPLPSSFTVLVADNCDGNVVITNAYNDVPSGCNIVRTITWTATDHCGNAATASRTFTTSDNVLPVLFNVPADASLECGQIIPDAVVFATDNCDDDVLVSLTAVTIPNECGYTLVRTWTAIDDCGNTASASQSTFVTDTTSPVLAGLPDNFETECGTLPIPESFNVTVTDNCDNDISVTGSFADSGSGCNMTRTLTWSATDACGNTISASRIVSVFDNIAPTLNNVPDNASVQCGSLPLPSEYGVTASDNCDLNLTITTTLNDTGSGCNIIRTITWSVQDACGNTASATRTFSTEDSVAPTIIGVPQDATMTCGDAVPDAVVSALDNCDTDIIISMAANTIQNSCGYSLIRTWTASDDCGNTNSASQTTFFEDHVAPVMAGLPAGGVVPCGQLPDGADFIVTASDNCSEVSEISFTINDNGQGCNLIRTITWTATDACGNASQASRIFEAYDETSPVLTGVPASMTITCDELTGPPAVTATDDCTVSLPVTFQETNSGGCPYTITRTWSATDACGNTVTSSQNITVHDEVAPVIYGNFEDLTMECDDIVPEPQAWAMDNCDVDVVLSLSASTESDGCLEIFSRVWTATDVCGNTSSQTQTIYIVDETEPVFNTIPQNVTVSCDALPAVPELSATDNCDNNVEILFSESVMSSGCPYQIKRVWSAQDDCGNTTTAVQVIEVTDNEGPTLNNIPLELFLQCGSALPQIPQNVYATDNCSENTTVEFTQMPSIGGCPSTVTRMWTATDECGNQTSSTQIIHFISPQSEPFYFNAFPNPSRKSELKITFGVATDTEVAGEVYDLSGRLVYTLMREKAIGGMVYQWSAESAGLAAGTYFIKMNAAGQSMIKKIIVLED